jgi:hypothetical protein
VLRTVRPAAGGEPVVAVAVGDEDVGEVPGLSGDPVAERRRLRRAPCLPANYPVHRTKGAGEDRGDPYRAGRHHAAALGGHHPERRRSPVGRPHRPRTYSHFWRHPAIFCDRLVLKQAHRAAASRARSIIGVRTGLTTRWSAERSCNSQTWLISRLTDRCEAAASCAWARCRRIMPPSIALARLQQSTLLGQAPYPIGRGVAAADI